MTKHFFFCIPTDWNKKCMFYVWYVTKFNYTCNFVFKNYYKTIIQHFIQCVNFLYLNQVSFIMEQNDEIDLGTT